MFGHRMYFVKVLNRKKTLVFSASFFPTHFSPESKSCHQASKQIDDPKTSQLPLGCPWFFSMVSQHKLLHYRTPELIKHKNTIEVRYP